MKYEHILSAFAAEPWAMQREKMAEVVNFLAFKAAGGELSAEEVAAVTSKRTKEVAKEDGAVAVIPIYGVLSQRMNLMASFSGGTSYTMIQKQLHQALADDSVKAVVLDIDSPGGAVPGTDELATEIRRLRGGAKPIVAQVNSLAASAAYWIASACDEIVVTPSGQAGSIGVYTVHEDISAALEKEGVKMTYISAGDFKVEGNPAEPLSKDAQDFIQSRVNTTYARFIESVAEGRGVPKSRVKDNYGKGRVFGASELIDRGMADKVATLDETLARFGAEQEPQAITKMKASNSARAEAAEELVAKVRAGEQVTKREFENGIRGLMGLSNSEAERAARLYLKDDQGDPGDDADAAALAAIEKVLAEAQTFNVNH